jgi:phage gp29-like protein
MAKPTADTPAVAMPRKTTAGTINRATIMFEKLKSAIGLTKPNKGDTQAGPRAGRDQTHNYLGVQTLDPSRLAGAFAQADTGHIDEQAKLFGLIEQHDPHIFSELAKRRRAITGLGWQLNAPKDATQAELDRTEELADMLRSIPRFEDAQYDITDAVGKGLSAHEIEWQTGSTWVPKALHFVPAYMLRIERTTGEVQYLNNGIAEPLQPSKWIVHEHRSISGYIEQAALFRVLAWTYAYKAYNTLDMQRFLEKYGLPLRLGKYPSGLGQKDRDELLRAVRGIGSDGAGVVPSTMSIEFVQAMKTGSVDDFLNAIEYWERKQSMAILGGTLTSQADGKTSTNALGQIHNEVRREIMLHDVRQIVPTVQAQLVRPIAIFNGMFDDGRMPTFGYDTAETVDQAAMVKVFQEAANMGLRIDVEHAHKVLQIPMADDKATVLQTASKSAAAPPGTPPDTKAALTRLVALAQSKGGDDASALPAYIAQLTALASPHEQALVQQIARIVSDAGGYEEAINQIEQLAVATRPTALAETIALGLAAAHLAGRGEV